MKSMFSQVPKAGAQGILNAMAAVASANAAYALSDIDRHTVEGAAHFVFRTEWTPAIISPDELKSVLLDPVDRQLAVQFLTVMCLVDAQIDAKRIRVAETYAQALGTEGPGLDYLVRSAQGHLQDVLACMMRQNILSLSGKSWIGADFMKFFLPYTDSPGDKALEARFENLGSLPEGTLGREYWQWYKSHGFAFPGNPSGLCWDFAVPHDSTHLLSGYDTSPRGELLVSTFTAGMHRQEPMEGHILPVIYSWHLNIRINDVATSSAGQFDPDHFWEAWERGSEMKFDVFQPGWDFWSAAECPLESLREEYGVPSLAPV